MDPPPFTLLSNKGQSEIIKHNFFLTFQWLCLILYLYKQFLRLGQNLPLSYSLLLNHSAYLDYTCQKNQNYYMYHQIRHCLTCQITMMKNKIIYTLPFWSMFTFSAPEFNFLKECAWCLVSFSGFPFSVFGCTPEQACNWKHFDALWPNFEQIWQTTPLFWEL